MTFTLVIGNKNYSSWSLRAWLVMRRAGAAFDEVVIPLDTRHFAEDLAKHSPSGRVPALKDGPLVVWDSLAIAEYAAERFPAASLWPEEVVARAAARSVSAEMHSGFVALREHMPFNARGRAARTPDSPAVIADVKRITTIWKMCRRSFGEGGPFLFGHFTIADAMYAPVVLRFQTYGVTLDELSRDYAETVLAMPEIGEWVEAARAEPHVIEKYEAALR